MRPPQNILTEVDSLPGEEIAFGIANVGLVMRSLADLYSNKELAITREYSTNAADAHIMAGVKRPIEVTLPSMIDPYFTVEDFGVGMSKQTLAERYTQFGDSDKHDSDDANGMLGYGCKSAVAYTTQFTVQSIKDGMKTVAVISRKPDYSIIMKIVASTKTTEPNGTKVQIPVHDTDKFNHMANEFYKYWTPGTVLVNGEEPRHAVGEKITDNLYYSEDSQSFVVMNNVAYRIANPSYLFRNVSISETSFVAYVPGSSVEFTPSREDLKYTDLTNTTLNRVVKEYSDAMIKKATDDMAAVTSHAEAYKTWVKWNNMLGSSALLGQNLTFKGDAVRSTYPIKGTKYTPDSYGYSLRQIESMPMESMERTLVITGFDGTVSSSQKSKVKEYSRLNNMGARVYVFIKEDKVDSPWFDQTRAVDWETLKASLPKKPRKVRAGQSGPGRLPGKWDFYYFGGSSVEADIPPNKDLFYISIQDDKQVHVLTALKLLNWKNAVVVTLAKNRIDKFHRDNPTVKEFLTEANKHIIMDGLGLIPQDARDALNMGYNTKRWVEALDISQIDDPNWKRAKVIKAKMDLEMQPYNDNLGLAVALGHGYNGGSATKVHTISGGDESLVEAYPLLDALHPYKKSLFKELYTYMNAKWAETHKKGK